MTRRQQVLLALMVTILTMAGAIPSPAGAAVKIGETFVPSGLCDVNTIFLQTSSPGGQYAAPFAGVITSWSFQASASQVPPLKFKVARPAGGATFTIVGEEGPRTPTPSVLNTYPARIAVRAGDVIGFHTVTAGLCVRSPAPGYGFHAAVGDPPPGTTFSTSSANGAQFDVSSVLEPDADNDGFGDESQDNCAGVSNPGQQDVDGDGVGAACEDEIAPDTTITGQPKAKTKKKKATFTFSGTDARVIAGFECSLNGAPFASCTSPLTVKGKKGKNSFAVRARDAAGNVDPTPATFAWKVKKKKKK
jgi:hypothetical protein